MVLRGAWCLARAPNLFTAYDAWHNVGGNHSYRCENRANVEMFINDYYQKQR